MKLLLAAILLAFACHCLALAAPAPLPRPYHCQRDVTPAWPVGVWESTNGEWLTEFRVDGSFRETKQRGHGAVYVIEGRWEHEEYLGSQDVIGQGLPQPPAHPRASTVRYTYGRDGAGLLRWGTIQYRRLR